jgi:hypothetical protein
VYPGGGYPGQYPPGGYPPGYPGGSPRGGSGIPMPRRSGKQPKETKDAKVPLPNFRGTLKQMDNKSITLELDDNRILDFKRNDKTKFFKNGDELKQPAFKPGDQVSVEGSQDVEGFFTAVNVYWEKGASAATKTGDGAVLDTWKDAPKDAPGAAPKDAPPAGQDHSAEVKPPPAPPDPSFPGPPVLRHGAPADPSREKAGPVPDAPQQADSWPEIGRPGASLPGAETRQPVPDPSILLGDNDVRIPQRQLDPLVRKASEAAMDFTESLPNYFCQEMIARFQSETNPANWRALDVVGTTVVYENGKEDYRDVAVNGKPVKKKLEEIGGAWSTGEFGTLLIDLFSPATVADFRYRKDSRIAGISAKEYDFSVKRENSHWNIHYGGQSFMPAYGGTVWIDPATARVMRVEMQAKSFPDEFPTDHVESAVDYEYVRLGDSRQYLLPVHAETLGCQRSSNFCSRNTIDFRNYKKYSGESSIQYTDVNSNVKYDDKPKTEDKKK